MTQRQQNGVTIIVIRGERWIAHGKKTKHTLTTLDIIAIPSKEQRYISNLPRMKLIQQSLALITVFGLTVSAFAPATTSSSRASLTPPPPCLRMGLFDGIMDYFSDEAKAKREEEKQRMLDEQEAAYREVLERRRSPELMDEYMEERKERLSKFTPKSEKEE